jgi:starch synthase
MLSGMKIVHVASELFPYIKTGGLADAVSALARMLARKGHEVNVFIPGYRSVLEHPDVAPHLTRGQRLRIQMGDSFKSGDLRSFSPEPNFTVHLICREEFFDRKLPYGNGERDYDDNHHRFIFFGKAVVEVMRSLDLDADILHGHDWQAGLVPLFLRSAEDRYATTLAIRTVHTIHNIAFQGLFPMKSFNRTNLPHELMGMDGVEFFGQVSSMKAGIMFADRVTTVSPQYAKEIQTPEFGCGLDGVIQTRAEDLIGLINGIDTTIWNPKVDAMIPANYGADDLAGKKKCRLALLKAHGMDPCFKGPIFGMVCRLAEQKGVQLLLENKAFFENENVKLIILGGGDAKLEQAVGELASAHPKKITHSTALDENMSHLVEAGCDFFLMPSLFEPCGLNQMYSQAYGTVPIVTGVGGLLDTVIDIDVSPETGTGIVVDADGAGLAKGVARAMDLFADQANYAATQRRGMLTDLSWDQAALAYEAFYAGEV